MTIHPARLAAQADIAALLRGRAEPLRDPDAPRFADAFDRYADARIDLLSPAEEQDRRNVFDIALLASPLVRATDWAAGYAETRGLKPAYFGASTGGGAALRAAAGDPRIAAVVSRGGRPDLAGREALAAVTAPTLLLVGARDGPVIELNQHAVADLHCPHELVIVPRAGHLFEVPGTLDRVVELASDWFRLAFEAPQS